MSELPDNWTTTPLGELVTPAGSKAGEMTDAPVYSVTKHTGFVPSEEYFSKQVYGRDLSGYRLVHPGEFAYATIHLDEGSIGIAPERALISPMYTAFRADTSQIDPQFLLHYLKSPRALAHYELLGSGSVHRRRSIPLKRLSSLPVPLPPLPEQRRIAAILDKAAETTGLQESRLGAVDKYARAITQDALHEADTTIKLGELLAGIDSGKSPVCEDRSAAPGEWAVLKLGAISSGIYRSEENKALKSTTTPSPDLEVRPGDLLLSRKNTRELVGATALVHDTPSRMLLPDLIFRLVPSAEAPVELEYLHATLNAPQVRRRLAELAGGSAASMVNISKAKLRKFEIPLPTLGVQRRVADQLRSVHELQIRQHHQLTRSQALSMSLRSRAFRGEL